MCIWFIRWVAAFENRRVKNDRIDARLLADLLRMGRLPECVIQGLLVSTNDKAPSLVSGSKSEEVPALHGITYEGGQAPGNALL